MSHLRIRTLKTDDVHFILSSWLMSNYALMIGRRPNKSVYYSVHQMLAKRALENEATLIACNKEDEDQIIGWINFGDNFLNYVYTKETFERMGIADALLAQTGLTDHLVCTHCTYQFQEKLGKKYKTSFNPYLFTMEVFNGDTSSEIRPRSEMRQGQ